MMNENGHSELDDHENGQAPRMASYQNTQQYLLDELPDEVSDDDRSPSDNSSQIPTSESTDDTESPSRTNLEYNQEDPPQIRLAENDGKVSIQPIDGEGKLKEQALERCAEIFGTSSRYRAGELIYRLFDFTEFIDGLNRREMVMNRMLAQLDEMNFDSELEGIQACQMLIADEIQQQMARKGMLAEKTELKEFYFEWAERFMKQTNKKMESLQDLQDDAEQTIRVERVDVSDGGQAMVGNFRKDDKGEGE